MSVVERSVTLTGLVVSLVLIAGACGPGLEVSNGSAVLALPSVPSVPLTSVAPSTSAPSGADDGSSMGTPAPTAPIVGSAPFMGVGVPSTVPSSVATHAPITSTPPGRPHLEAAVASGDLCEVNDALEEMVETSDDGLRVASEMRAAADAADSARAVVPPALRDAWDVVTASTRRYADALISAGGDASVPDVRAIRSDAAFERASSRVASWIRDHCGDDGS